MEFLKRVWCALFLMMVLAPAVEAQVELGFDSGMVIEQSGGLQRTTFRLPGEYLRIGFPRTLTFETLLGLTHRRASGQSTTVLKVLPGLVFNYRAGTYVRVEVGMLLINDAWGSLSQFAHGIAVGTKRQLGRGPLSLRMETGITKWQASRDFAEGSDFRFLVGLSAVIG